MELKRVVVTGLGALTPIGNTVLEYWNGLLEGVSGATLITQFDASNFKSQIACEVKNFDVSGVLDRKEARKYDRFAQFALTVANEAVKDANFDLEKENLDRFGVIWGTGIGGIKTIESEITDFAKGDGTPRFNPFLIPKMIIDIAPGHISMRYGFRGINYSTVSACASSTHALADAFNYIRLGKADVILAGGAEASVTPVGVGGFTAMHALSTRNNDPATASRPFSKSRDGFVIGEGAACLVLEEYEHAKARGAHIYAEMVGTGMTADAHHMTAPHPEGIGALNVMRLAVEDGGLNLNEIDYINVHGTSTPLGDIAECKAIQQLFGEHAYDLNISSTKSMTGHLLGATGAAEAVACVLAVKNDIVPPTINFTEGDEDPEIDYKLNFTFGKPQKRIVRAALSNTFGFGGHNASVVFKKVTE